MYSGLCRHLDVSEPSIRSVLATLKLFLGRDVLLLINENNYLLHKKELQTLGKALKITKTVAKVIGYVGSVTTGLIDSIGLSTSGAASALASTSGAASSFARNSAGRWIDLETGRYLSRAVVEAAGHFW